jgi:hypothetical protein
MYIPRFLTSPMGPEPIEVYANAWNTLEIVVGYCYPATQSHPSYLQRKTGWTPKIGPHILRGGCLS